MVRWGGVSISNRQLNGAEILLKNAGEERLRLTKQRSHALLRVFAVEGNEQMKLGYQK